MTIEFAKVIDRPIRVLMQQPTLAKYRVPVYRALANRPNIDLTVYYGAVGDIPNRPAEGFKAVSYRRREFPRPVSELVWNPLPPGATDPDRCDVLILNWNIRHVSLLPALLRARSKGVPVLVWGHGYSKHESAWRRWARWSITNLCTGVILYSHTIADDLTSAGFDRSRIFVAPNTIDQAEIQAARQWWVDHPAELEAFKHERALGKRPHLLFVSRLEKTNRTDLLLRAVSDLRQFFPDVCATVIGDGVDGPRLHKMAASLGIADRVRFTGAIYQDKNLAPWFLSSDLFVYPSNIGLSLQHAMGFGLPVVVGDTLHLHGPEVEALRDGVNGAFFRHDDPADLVRVLRDLLADPQRVREMSAAAHHTATKVFTLDRMVDGVELAIRYAATKPVVEHIDRVQRDPELATF